MNKGRWVGRTENGKNVNFVQPLPERRVLLANIVLQGTFLLRCTIGLFTAQVVEANKEVGVQECRRWKPWALWGENSEFIAGQPQTTLNAKWARPRPRTAARNRIDGGMMYRNEVGVTMKILPNASLPSSNSDGKSSCLYSGGHGWYFNVCRMRANPEMGMGGEVSAATVVVRLVNWGSWRGYDYEPWSNGHPFLAPLRAPETSAKA